MKNVLTLYEKKSLLRLPFVTRVLEVTQEFFKSKNSWALENSLIFFRRYNQFLELLTEL